MFLSYHSNENRPLFVTYPPPGCPASRTPAFPCHARQCCWTHPWSIYFLPYICPFPSSVLIVFCLCSCLVSYPLFSKCLTPVPASSQPDRQFLFAQPVQEFFCFVLFCWWRRGAFRHGWNRGYLSQPVGHPRPGWPERFPCLCQLRGIPSLVTHHRIIELPLCSGIVRLPCLSQLARLLRSCRFVGLPRLNRLAQRPCLGWFAQVVGRVVPYGHVCSRSTHEHKFDTWVCRE